MTSEQNNILPAHFDPRLQHLHDKFHVIAVISNPVRFKSRYELYRKFERHVKCAGANLWTVETAFGERPFEVTESRNPRHIQFRSEDELWHKENMINLAVMRLPFDWKYVAWIDADIMFNNPDWVEETIQQLQHYHFVQMFGTAIDLGPRGEPLTMHRGFVKAWIELDYKCPNKRAKPGETPYYGGISGSFAHTGYAWACTREAFEHLGGLIDWAILGSADHHMAMALIGESEKTFPGQIDSRYELKIKRWEKRALDYLHRDIGYVPGTITHFWHGKKRDRGYTDRWQILIDNAFDPDKDLMRDSQGIWRLTHNNWRLRDHIRSYFRSRNEDSIDL